MLVMQVNSDSLASELVRPATGSTIQKWLHIEGVLDQAEDVGGEKPVSSLAACECKTKHDEPGGTIHLGKSYNGQPQRVREQEAVVGRQDACPAGASEPRSAHAVNREDTKMGSSQPERSSESGWYYMDPKAKGNTQGPFSAPKMKVWYEIGYIGPDLPIQYRDSKPSHFVPFAKLFPKGTEPFGTAYSLT
ncbi:unnamed protein product [Amoebophrya sp. A25]|nr:unnamed protein product [Amoebophrya sp. A25]|eukprot:GSA25T00013653001.1